MRLARVEAGPLSEVAYPPRPRCWPQLSTWFRLGGELRTDITELVDDALSELRAWRDSEPDGVRRPTQFYVDLEHRLRRMRGKLSLGAIDWIYHDVMQHIMKGPATEDFLPSLERISRRIAASRKR